MLNDRTTRGFTGHEHADQVGLIHMNGRTYDPWLGRFMQPDPVVQDAMNGQNLNRYSYVLNNPMRYTDPSGYYWFDGSWSDIRFVALSSSYRWNGTFSSTDYFRVPVDYVREQNSWGVNIVLSNLAAGTVSGAFSTFKAPGVESYQVTTDVGTAIAGGAHSELTSGSFAGGSGTAAMAQAVNPIQRRFGNAKNSIEISDDDALIIFKEVGLGNQRVSALSKMRPFDQKIIDLALDALAVAVIGDDIIDTMIEDIVGLVVKGRIRRNPRNVLIQMIERNQLDSAILRRAIDTRFEGIGLGARAAATSQIKNDIDEIIQGS